MILEKFVSKGGDVDGDVGGDDASVGYMSRGGRLTSLDASFARCFAF